MITIYYLPYDHYDEDNWYIIYIYIYVDIDNNILVQYVSVKPTLLDGVRCTALDFLLYYIFAYQ